MYETNLEIGCLNSVSALFQAFHTVFSSNANIFLKCKKWKAENMAFEQYCKVEEDVKKMCSACRTKHFIRSASWAFGQHVVERKKALGIETPGRDKDAK